MGTISRTAFVTNEIPSGAVWDSNFSTLYDVINGNIEPVNLATGAVTTDKILDGQVTPAKLENDISFPKDHTFSMKAYPVTINGFFGDSKTNFSVSDQGADDVEGMLNDTSGANRLFFVYKNAANTQDLLDNASLSHGRIFTLSGADISMTGITSLMFMRSDANEGRGGTVGAYILLGMRT